MLKAHVKNLLEIQMISLQIETNTSVYNTLDGAKAMFYMYMQGGEESNTKYLRNFKSITEAVEHLIGNIFVENALIGVKSNEDDTKVRHIKSDKEYIFY